MEPMFLDSLAPTLSRGAQIEEPLGVGSDVAPENGSAFAEAWKGCMDPLELESLSGAARVIAAAG